MINLAYNMTYTTATMDALASIGFKPADHDAVSFIFKGDRHMIITEAYQGDTHVESKVMMGNANHLINDLIEECGYVGIFREHTYLWKNVLAITDTESGHHVYLAKGAY